MCDLHQILDQLVVDDILDEDEAYELFKLLAIENIEVIYHKPGSWEIRLNDYEARLSCRLSGWRGYIKSTNYATGGHSLRTTIALLLEHMKFFYH